MGQTVSRLQAFLVASALSFFSALVPFVTQPASAAATTVDNYLALTGGNLKSSTNDAILPTDSGAAYTVEAWINPTATDANWRTILNQHQGYDGTNSTTAQRFYLGLYSGQVHVGISGEVLTSDAVVTANQWTHVAVSVGSDDLVTIYLDGYSVASKTFTRTEDLGPGFSIGAILEDSFAFAGAIDQVKVWESALDASQINASMHAYATADVPGSPTLLALYDMNRDDSASGAVIPASDGTASIDLSATGNYAFSSLATSSTTGMTTTVTFPRTYLTSAGGWQKPAGLTQATVLLVGGGGSGGNTYDNKKAGAGSGAAALEQSANIADVTRIVVGQGGQKHTTPPDITTTSDPRFWYHYAAGRAGQTSTFGSLSAAGGAAGGGRGAADVATSTSLTSAITGSSYGVEGAYASTLTNIDGVDAGPNTGNGGGGASATSGSFAAGVENIGGNGGSGVVVVQYSTLFVAPVSGAAKSTVKLSGHVLGDFTDAVLRLSSKFGTLSISSANLTISGATQAGSYSDTGASVLSLRGSSSQLSTALSLVDVELDSAFTSSGSIAAELVPVASPMPSGYSFSPVTGHYYKAEATATNYATAKATADSSSLTVGGVTLGGYLANMTSSTENAYVSGTVAAALQSFYFGAREDGDGQYKWSGGPESGILFSSGLTPNTAPVGGSFVAWASGEPNNNGGAGAQNCAVSNFRTADYGTGAWDDVECTSTLAYVIEYGGAGDNDFSTQANVTITQPVIYVDFTELDFDYSNTTNIVGNGKSAGNKVLFENVSVRDGLAIDALVTTAALSGSGTTITNYDVNTGAGGEDSFFEVDIKIPANNGYADFEFSFYLHGTYGQSDQTQVILRDVNVSAIDIDYYQFNDFTGVDGYTFSSPTYLTVQNRNPATGFPADLRFQGRSGYATNDPRDMAVATYGEIETFTIRMGSTRGTSRSDNLYGVAFKALPFGNYSTQTQGATYTLTYDGNGASSGSAPADVTGSLGANIVASGNTGTLVRTGYVFSGWNTRANGTGVSYPVGSTYYMPQDGGTLYAVWVPQQFTLSYDANGGSAAPGDTLVNAGASTSVSATVPVRAGFTFTGWNTVADGSGQSYASSSSLVMPAENLTLYAIWVQATGTLTYDANGGSGAPSNQTGNVGSQVSVSAAPTSAKTGHSFLGWNTSSAGTGTRYAPGDNFTIANGTTTLYAEWAPVLYTLSFSANSGSGSIASVSKLAGENHSLPAGTSLSRSGYTFSGWNSNASGTGTDYAVGASYSMPASNVTLFAKWTPIDYNVTYDANGGTGAPSDANNYNVGASVVTEAVGSMQNTGMRFIGWNTAANGSGSSYVAGQAFVMPASDVTLYAQWVDASFDIAYNANGGTGAPSGSAVPNGQSYTISTTEPTRTGYLFSGWVLQDGSPAGTFKTGGSTSFVPNGDELLVAQWTPVDYALAYSANGGSGAPSGATKNFQDSVTVSSTIPSRSGFTFLGWNTASNGSGISYSGAAVFSMPAQDLTLYAQWQGNPQILSYSSNGGSGSPGSETRATAEVFQLSGTSPTRNGYTFSGWNTAADGSGSSLSPNGSFTMPGQAVTLYAQWSVRTFTLAYNANGGSGAPSSQTHAFDSTAQVSASLPQRVGYTFTGWNTAANGSGTTYAPADSFNMPATDITLYAQWGQQVKLVSYDANGGIGAPSPQSEGFGATVTVSATVPTRAGFSFDAWNTVSDGSGTRYAGSDTFTMPANDVVLFAIWLPSAYTVSFNANLGSQAPGVIASKTGLTVTVPQSTPVRPGYTFVEWNTSQDGSGTSYGNGSTFTMPPNNVVLFAQWTAISYTLTYDANQGANPPGSQTGAVGSAQTIAAVGSMSRTGYRFVGWNSNADGTGADYAAGATISMPLNGTTLYAKWIGENVEIAYNDNGGSGGPGTSTPNIGDTYAVSSTEPTRTGFTFLGWVILGGGPTVYKDGTGTNSFTVTNDMTLVAQWQAIDFTLTFDLNLGGKNSTGSAPGPYTVATDAVEILPDDSTFTRADSNFLGWGTLADGSGSLFSGGDSFTMPAANVTLFAQWSEVYFVIEFNPNGGTGAPADTLVPGGATVTVPATTPSRAGYQFNGWTKTLTNSTVNPGDSFTMPSTSVLMVANWQAIAQGGGSSLPILPPPVVSDPLPDEPEVNDDGSTAEPVADQLADTGFDAVFGLPIGLGFVALGTTLLVFSRRGRRKGLVN